MLDYSGRPVSLKIRVFQIAAFVAFGLIAVAVLWPVYSTNGRSGPTFRCLSNVKQIGLGQIMYASDHDDRLTFAGRWIDLTFPYVKQEESYRCPTLKKGEYGYAMNDAQSSINVKSSKEPAKEVLTFETNDLQRNAHGAFSPDRAQPRHGRSIVVGYMDAHAKRVISQ